MSAKRYFKQSFTVSGSQQTDPIDALKAALLAGTATPYDNPASLGVDLTGTNGVAVFASVNEGETIEAGSLLAFVYGAVDIAADGLPTARRWAILGGQTAKELPISVRDGVVVFEAKDLPQEGRLLVLPQGLETSAGGTSLQLTYAARRSYL